MDQFLEIFRSIPCGYEDWKTVWGDPWFSGSVFMLAYGVAGWLMLKVSRLAGKRESWLWRMCAFLFFFQVFNTHLDLHAFVVSYGRCLSRAQGWYDTRNDVQQLVLIVVFVTAACLILLTVLIFRRSLVENPLLVLGTTIALGMTVVKGINYHHFEKYYGQYFGPFRGADLVELSGILIALAAAMFWLRKLRTKNSTDIQHGN